MPNSPLVSIVVPAFNASAYLREALESALGQTYRHIEIVVVDDGSQDHTAEIVEEIACHDSRIRLIRQSNAGVAAARNCGIAAARGEFIAPLDADDIWDETKLERQVRRMLEGGLRTGLVYSWWIWIDENRNVLDASPRWQLDGDVLEKLIEINFTGNASVPLYRRECLEEVGGYNTSLRGQGGQGCEDWDLALRVAERYTAASVPAFLVGYRRLSNSMSADLSTMWKSQSLVMQELHRRQPEIPSKAFRRSQGQFALYLAGVCFRSQSYLKALEWGIRAGQPGLALAVLPSLIPVLARRLAGKPDGHDKVRLDTCRFDQAKIFKSIVPYDRIYSHRWQRRGNHPGWKIQMGHTSGVVSFGLRNNSGDGNFRPAPSK
jgi:hypothetical protein